MIKAAHVTGLERLELERLRDRVGRLFDALQEATLADAPATPGAWSPPVDLCETADAVTMRVELPGVAASQIKIALTSAHLRICGEKKKRTPRTRIISHLCSERSYGHFMRTVPLRWTIDVSEATAELENGVLTVRLPKRKDRRGAQFRVTIKENEE
ncbi:MAG TPA: Hsp20/alpha crystallin family protein [Pyrinomonadaceae bacterium]|jgi:HSP20 family protein|nr:Hsp20/alpha crystallin family protein [Pyrinomonadaceae bacterium]